MTLYYHALCPYCIKVWWALRKMAFPKGQIEWKSIRNRDFLNELIRVGGKKQVPCLVTNDQALYESDDIIGKLKAIFNDLVHEDQDRLI